MCPLSLGRSVTQKGAEVLNPRESAHNLAEVAEQVIEDMRADIDGSGMLDVVATVATHQLTENDLVGLVAKLAERVVMMESRRTAEMS